jgi:hypothetical protein
MKKPKMKFWNRHNAQSVVRKARETWGSGWNMLSDDAKTAAVKAEVLSVLIVQMDKRADGTETEIPVWAIKELYRESLREAGLLDEEV